MLDSSLERFGRIFIKDVRDRSICLFDKKIHGDIKDKVSQELFKRVDELGTKEKELICDIIPDIVDLSIHNMLCMFEEHNEFLLMVENVNLNDVSDGLAGELYSEDGWIVQYSKQRYGKIL